MNIFYMGFEDVERGLQELRKAMALRNKMCGDVYADVVDVEIFNEYF